MKKLFLNLGAFVKYVDSQELPTDIVISWRKWRNLKSQEIIDALEDCNMDDTIVATNLKTEEVMDFTQFARWLTSPEMMDKEPILLLGKEVGFIIFEQEGNQDYKLFF